MTREEFYALPLCGGRVPPPGARIRTNYGQGLMDGYVVKSVARDRHGRLGFVLEGPFYLNDFVFLEDGRLCRNKRWKPGSAAYARDPGLHGDGRDEIRVERWPRQEDMFWEPRLIDSTP